MTTWHVGHVEKSIVPPMRDAVTVYSNVLNGVIIYVAHSPFLRDTQGSTKDIAQRIADALNQAAVSPPSNERSAMGD